MPLNFERALVTGGAGFIGSHIVDRLIEEKCHVNVIDDLSFGIKENLAQHERSKHLQFHHASILDTPKLKQAMKEVETVFHEAAIVSPEYATQNPAQTSSINVQGTLNLLETARQQEPEHFIYASSASVYGASDKLPITEEAPTKPLSPYGASKLSGELFVQSFHETYGLKTTCLRYFNVYGPRQMQNPYSGVITIFLQNLREHEALSIQGDGEQTRDFIYVTDVVEANLQSASSKTASGEIFNIATGKPSSINQLADILGSILDLQVSRRRVAARRGDIRHSYADTKRAEELLGFKAKISFREGLQRYIDGMQPAHSR